MNQADLIVVGAGSAGCVLASRLAQEYGFRVTLVEPPSTAAPRVDRIRPSRWLNLLGSDDDWNLCTEPSVGLAQRKMNWPRGRGMGGSSRINAMIWFPPTEHDLQMMVDASGGQWTTGELQTEYESTRAKVRPERARWLSDSSTRFMDAVENLAGAKPMIYERVNRQGRRWNPATLLCPVNSDCPPVDVVRATVDRLTWDGDRATGVRIVAGESERDLCATRGVVLCAGTIGTAAILMRSGIGPSEELARHRIDTRVERSSVGDHLQDHLIMPVIFRTRSSYNFTAHPSVRELARWQSLGSGPIASNLAECGGLFNHDTLQIHVTPTNYLTFPKPSDTFWMTIGVNLTQPTSQGSIKLGSRSLDEQPTIDARYLDNDSDRVGTIQAVRWARLLARKTRLAEWIIDEDVPGTKRESDESLTKSITRYAQTLYHPVGTCRMGRDNDAVIDSQFAVRGTEKLWVADASILPRLTRGNPNAMVMSLAWMAAETVARQAASTS